MRILDKAVVAGSLLSAGCTTPGNPIERVFGPWEETVQLTEGNGGGAREDLYDRGLYTIQDRTAHTSYLAGEEAFLSFSAGEALKVWGKLSLGDRVYQDPEIRFERDGALIVDSAVVPNLHLWGIRDDAVIYEGGRVVERLGNDIPAKVYGSLWFRDEEISRMKFGDYVPEAHGLYAVAKPYQETEEPNKRNPVQIGQVDRTSNEAKQ